MDYEIFVFIAALIIILTLIVFGIFLSVSEGIHAQWCFSGFLVVMVVGFIYEYINEELLPILPFVVIIVSPMIAYGMYFVFRKSKNTENGSKNTK